MRYRGLYYALVLYYYGASENVIVIAPSRKNSKTNTTPMKPHARLATFGVAQAIETYHVQRKEHGNAAVGVVWPREVHQNATTGRGVLKPRFFRRRFKIVLEGIYGFEKGLGDNKQ
jgi:hypothetical protein